VIFQRALLSGINDKGLATLKRLRRSAIYLITGYAPVALMLSTIHLRHTGTLVLMELLVLCLVTLWHLRLTECPKCGQHFYANGLWGSTSSGLPFGTSCMHCDFSLQQHEESF
jgi:hypothetical protein